MINYTKQRWGIAALVAALTLSGCSDSFYEVRRPNIVDAGTVDPEADAELFSWSAYQNFSEAYGGLIVYGAWFTNEARVGDTYPTRNDFGLRRIDDRNGTHRDEVWIPLARALSSTEDALATLGGAPGAESSVDVARVALAAGYTVQLMAENFCYGVVEPLGSRQDEGQMLDHAKTRFQQAISTASAAGDNDMANAARVGLARAHLQRGELAEAAQVAKLVPADFVYDVIYVDDASNRTRLGNNVYYFTHARESLNVGPEWRALADAGDTRIGYFDTGGVAQDAELHLYKQTKYEGYGSPIRLASGLEARYIIAEAELATNLSGAVELINERRAASGQGGTFSSTDQDEVLAELMDQRARDFWLEGKRLGDWRRNPDHVPYILPAGSTYYKPGQGTIGDQTCMPMSASETDNNPNY